MGRSPTIDDDSCTGDAGSPSDGPSPYAIPTRSTLRLSPAEQPTARRLGDGRIQDGAVPGLVGPRLPALRDGHDRVGHPLQRVDRRDGGGVAIRGGVGRRQRRGASGEGEIVQRGEDQRGVPLAARRARVRASAACA
jgi:hypothetical protein